MRPLFTVHAGEYLVGRELEEKFSNLEVWIPSRDTGVDLLVTDKLQKTVARLQVKFSKDHLASGKEARATEAIKSGGWWSFDREKLAQSRADYWVLVLCEFTSRKYDYIVIPPSQLLARYEKIAPGVQKIQSYFWVTRQGLCWETRGLGTEEYAQVCAGTYRSRGRNFSRYLNAWPFTGDA